MSGEWTIRLEMDSIAVSELHKNIYEIEPNWHPELEKYFTSAGIDGRSGYPWCAFYKHYVNTMVGVPGYGGWAANWIKDRQAIKKTPEVSDGFAIPRTGGSGWHVGHVHLVYKPYIITIEGNIKDRLLSRKILRTKKGLTFFSHINKRNR